MIAGAGQRRRQTGEDPLGVVLDRADLAVHQLAGAHHLAAKGLANSLMAQADAKDGHLAGHVLDERNQNTGFAWRAGPGRKQNAVGAECLNLFGRQLVIAAYHDLGAQFSQVLHKVVGKRIVVVENEDHCKASVARTGRLCAQTVSALASLFSCLPPVASATLKAMVLHFLIGGRVQGVGFRWFVQREAAQLDLRGWVRNTEEGEVEVLAAGACDELDRLRRSLERGPRGSRVDRLQEQILDENHAEELGSFRIDGAW